MTIKTSRTNNVAYFIAVIFILSVISFVFTTGAPTEDVETSWSTSIAGNITMASGDAFDNTFVIAQGSSGFFLEKYDPLGNKRWTHLLRDDNLNTPTCVTTDAEGNCYVGGQTSGTTTLVGLDLEITGTHSFVAKYTSEGLLLWNRLIGSTRSDTARRMVIDEDSNCFVVGNTGGMIDGQGAASGTNPFVAKISTMGELIWVGQLRESAANSGHGVGVDEDGYVHIAGKPGYVATFDCDGSLVQFHRLVGSFPSLMDVAVDSLGNTYLCGWDGGYTGYAVKYNRDGVRMWERQYRLNGWSCPKSIAAFTDGSNHIISGGCQGGPSGGTSCEAFARRFDTDGNLISVYASPPNLCGQHVGIDSVGGWYMISDNVVIKIEPSIYATAPLELEAESAVIEGCSIETAQTGYSGSGYVQFNGDSDGRVEWNANVSQPGTKTLIWKCKNTTSQTIPVSLQVNGLNTNPNLLLESTSISEDWASLSAEVYLCSGSNIIDILIPTTGEQGLCLDRLEVIDVEDSVALGKAVICSRETRDHPASDAIDGRLASSWIIDECPQWIEIDLGQDYPVNQIKLTGQSTGAFQFEIEVKSATEEAFRQIVDGRNNETALTTTDPIVSVFDETPARYIRLTITGNADGGSVQIQEFGIFVLPQRPSISIGTEGYRTIQAAMDNADFGSTITLEPGLYTGNGNVNLQWHNKNFTLTSVNVNDPLIVAGTVIQGDGETPVLSLSDISQESMIMGLTVTGGLAGVHCQDASPIITHCRIVENDGSGIEMQVKSDPLIRHTLICDNDGVGIMMTPESGRTPKYNEPDIINCTIAQNALGGLMNGRFAMRNCIVWGNGIGEQAIQLFPMGATVSYSCIQGGFSGEGNIDVDPMFESDGNYHLLPESPCIDAGDPADSVEAEPLPNGGRINMGAYGGTINATCR